MSDLTKINRDRQEFDDQQNELAGRETGRRSRFGVGSNATQAIAEKKSREFRTALQLLLNDPEYARLHQSLGDALSDAESKTDATIENAQRLLNQARSELSEILDRAPRLRTAVQN